MIRYFALPVLIQVLLIIHVLKTGRERFWIWILILIPLAGGLAYLLVEVLPSFFTRQRVNQIGSSVGEMFSPGGKLGKLENQASFSPTFRNICNLGDAYLDAGRFAEAATCYTRALEPPFEKNDEYLYKQAYALYMAHEFAEAEEAMKQVSEVGRGKLKAKELALRARILEGLEKWEDAERDYLEASEKSGDLSFRVDYARFLNRTERKKEARKEYEVIVGTYDRLPSNFKKQYRGLMGEVRNEYAVLKNADYL